MTRAGTKRAHVLSSLYHMVFLLSHLLALFSPHRQKLKGISGEEGEGEREVTPEEKTLLTKPQRRRTNVGLVIRSSLRLCPDKPCPHHQPPSSSSFVVGGGLVRRSSGLSLVWLGAGNQAPETKEEKARLMTPDKKKAEP